MPTFCLADDRTRLLCLVVPPESARGPRHPVTRPGPLRSAPSSLFLWFVSDLVVLLIFIDLMFVYVLSLSCLAPIQELWAGLAGRGGHGDGASAETSRLPLGGPTNGKFV